MNNTHESIKFTMETETSGKLPFLDVLVTRNTSGGPDTKLYKKAIASNSYIPASANHAHSIKHGIIKIKFGRARNVCNNAPARQREEKKLIDIFALNGYRRGFIRNSSRSAPPQTRAVELATGGPATPSLAAGTGTGGLPHQTPASLLDLGLAAH